MPDSVSEITAIESTVQEDVVNAVVSVSRISAMLNAAVVEAEFSPNVVEAEVGETVVHAAVIGMQGPQGPQGTSGTVEVDESLVSLEWGTPTTESGNAIEVTGSLRTFTGDALLSSVVDVQVVVTDSATDAEPSATATLAAASTPVGTVLAGSGTATMTIRTDAGQLAIRASEPSAAHRYLWLRNGGHSRMWIRSLTGVQELVFA
jgi:hypothetical protein